MLAGTGTDGQHAVATKYASATPARAYLAAQAMHFSYVAYDSNLCSCIIRVRASAILGNLEHSLQSHFFVLQLACCSENYPQLSIKSHRLSGY